ncbi:Alpha/Beta hydrolase protein [Mycena galericulata]|nr:Alpha/Beta hydrolase protein [Mycena galericulata]
MAEFSHLSDPDLVLAPQLAHLKATAPPPPDNISERRKLFNSFIEAAQAAYAPRLPKDTEYRLADHQLQVLDGNIRVRSLIPVAKEGSHQTYPLMVWIHGGGWMNGNIEFDDYQLRAICVELQISILNVEYRLAPEHPHPTGLNDCYSALKWAAYWASFFSADLQKGFLVCGLSAGGNLAAILAHRARVDPFFKDKQLTGQLLQVPVIVHPDAAPEKYKPRLLSFEQNKDAPLFNAKDAFSCYDNLGGSPTDPEVSPLLYPSHGGLPPAFIQVCGLDPLRDEAFLYEALLRGAGVKTKIIAYPGVPHGFQYLFSSSKMATKWEEDYKEGIRFLLDVHNQ